MRSSGPRVHEIREPGSVEELFEPETRAVLEARGVALDPAAPPRPYEWAEIQTILVEAGRDILRAPFGLIFPTYDDAEAICRKPELGAMGAGGILASGVSSGPLFELFPHLMFSMDGAEHERLRSLVSQWFTPKAVEACRRPIRAQARELLDPLLRRGHGELVGQLADPLALGGACIRLGLEPEVVARIRNWTGALFEAFLPMTPEQVARAEEAALGLGAFADEALAERRRAPRPDLLAHLLESADAGALSPAELRAMVVNLLFGGHDLTRGAIANAVFTVLRFRDAWEELVADPGRAETVAEECLRFQPPAAAVARLARVDTAVRGCPIAAGTVVVAGGAAANRDRRHVDDPHRFDPDRRRSKLFTFGAGPHYCLGANLARLTLAVALETLATAAPGLRLGCALEEVEWDPGRGIPSVRRLPVRTGATPAGAP